MAQLRHVAEGYEQIHGDFRKDQTNKFKSHRGEN